MAATHKGAISFGLVHIPVALHTATQDNDIHFNQLCKEDGSRVKYKKVCANCGKEVGFQDIVKGFEFGPIFFDKTYHAVVEAGGDKAYELLRQAMFDEGKVAIAKTVMGQSEKLLCLIPTEKGILAETLFFYDEVKEIPKEAAHPELNEAELNMAKMLIGSMDKEFEPQLYHNEYQVRLREIIEAKINGQEIVQTPAEQESNVINIMEALQASLQQIEGTTPPKKPRGRKKAATA